MKMKLSLFFIPLLVISFGCKDKASKEIVVSPESEDFQEEDYQQVQGIILKTVINPESSSKAGNDIYYVYNLQSPEPNLGVVINSEKTYKEDDLVIVFVNMNNKDISVIKKRGMIDQELLYQYLKRGDSSYYRMKERVPLH